MYFVDPIQMAQMNGNPLFQSQILYNNSANLLALASFKSKKPIFKPHSKFNDEEDARLRELVEQFGDNSWIKIATEMPGRNSRQCRERWLNYLSPHLNTNEWTPEEDELLLEKQKELGTSWVRICKFFEGRTDQMCKNRYFLLQRKLDKKAYKRRNISSQQTVNMISQQILFPFQHSSFQLSESSSCTSSPAQFEIKTNVNQKDLAEKKQNNIEVEAPIVSETTNVGFHNVCEENFDNFFNLSDDNINGIELDDFYMI